MTKWLADLQLSPMARLVVLGAMLIGVGLGCGQVSIATTVGRDEFGIHSGEWSVTMVIDEQVQAKINELSDEPIDWEHRAELFRDEEWTARALPNGNVGSTTFFTRAAINDPMNALVKLFAEDGQVTENSIVRETSLDLDETDPARLVYTYRAEVSVPEVDKDKVLEDLTLSLSQGDIEIPLEDVQELKQALYDAGDFVVEYDVTLPGAVDPGSVNNDGSANSGTVRWRLTEAGTYLLEAKSVWTPDSVAGKSSNKTEKSAEPTTVVSGEDGPTAEPTLTEEEATSELLGALGTAIFGGDLGVEQVQEVVEMASQESRDNAEKIQTKAMETLAAAPGNSVDQSNPTYEWFELAVYLAALKSEDGRTLFPSVRAAIGTLTKLAMHGGDPGRADLFSLYLSTLIRQDLNARGLR